MTRPTRLVFAMLLALLASCGWTPRQKLLAATSTTLLVVDWRQTVYITARCSEGNPVLGPCGERFPIDAYFGMVIALNLWVGMLTPEWREVLWGGVIGAEGATVWSNSTGYGAVPVW